MITSESAWWVLPWIETTKLVKHSKLESALPINYFHVALIIDLKLFDPEKVVTKYCMPINPSKIIYLIDAYS